MTLSANARGRSLLNVVGDEETCLDERGVSLHFGWKRGRASPGNAGCPGEATAIAAVQVAMRNESSTLMQDDCATGDREPDLDSVPGL